MSSISTNFSTFTYTSKGGNGTIPRHVSLIVYKQIRLRGVNGGIYE